MQNHSYKNNRTNLILYCPLWGMDHLSLEDALQKIKEAGYHGTEIALNPDVDDLSSIKKLFDELGLRMLAQHPFGRGNTPGEYLENYISKLAQITEINPDMINCHTGKDYFSVKDNLKIIEAAETVSAQTGTMIAHEIHRGRFSFSSALIGEYLNRFPGLKLTADFSHWCVVSESLLEDQEEIMTKTIPHCVHTHARVGNSQSAQVNHPEAPENKPALERHTQWWKSIYDHHKKTNKKEYTITCEFGPAPYLPGLPFTNQPVASQWEINLFIKEYLIKKYDLWQQAKD